MPLRCTLKAIPTLTLLACSAWAQETPPAQGGGLGLKLKLQEQLLPPVAPDASQELPVFVEADQLQGAQNQYLEGQGNVVLRTRLEH